MGEELWLFRQVAADAKRACVKASDTVVHGPAAEVTKQQWDENPEIMPWGLFSTPLGDRAMKQEGAEEKRWAALYRAQRLKVKTELRLLGFEPQL